MKKIFAVTVIFIFAAAMAGCSYVRYEPLPKKTAVENFYTPLDIDVIYAGGDEFELQIGLYDDAMVGAENDDLIQLGNEIGNRVGKTVEYLDYNIYSGAYYGNNQGVISIDGILSSETYCYYSYLIKGEANLTLKNKHFGFFEYRYEYEVETDYVVKKIYSAAIEIAKVAVDNYGGYKVDENAIYCSFDLCVDKDLEAENASHVLKRLALNDYEPCECMVFEIEDLIVFPPMIATYESMASGWYIVPILLGIVVSVIILLLKPRRKEEQIFRMDESQIDNINKNQINGPQADINEDKTEEKDGEQNTL